MTDAFGVIPAPEHRSPRGADDVTVIGTVTGINDRQVKVIVNCDLVIIDAPAELLGTDAVKFCGYVAVAIRQAALYEGQNSSADGGGP